MSSPVHQARRLAADITRVYRNATCDCFLTRHRLPTLRPANCRGVIGVPGVGVAASPFIDVLYPVPVGRVAQW